MSVGETLNMDSCSKFCGNLDGIWGNPGEIPHIGWKIPRVYRVKGNVKIPCLYSLKFDKESQNHLGGSVKGRFNEPTEKCKINHLCIQNSCRVLQTSWHRRMDIGAVLADN